MPCYSVAGCDGCSSPGHACHGPCDGLRIYDVALAIGRLRPFITHPQLCYLIQACNGPHAFYFRIKLLELDRLIEKIPSLYAGAGAGPTAMVYLHYLTAGSDWYVTQLSRCEGTCLAFGYSILNGCSIATEADYIDLDHLVTFGAEMDLMFEPATLDQTLTSKTRHRSNNSFNSDKFMAVAGHGDVIQQVCGVYATASEAAIAQAHLGTGQVPRRRP